MKLFSPFSFLLLAFLLALVSASPIPIPRQHYVYNPHITSPSSSTVWYTGTKAEVSWNVDDLPESMRDKEGKIVLGHWTEDGGEHLDIDHPLAAQFPISKGKMTVKVPTVEPRDDYFVVVFGDSGNMSPNFTITTTAKEEESPSLLGLPGIL